MIIEIQGGENIKLLVFIYGIVFRRKDVVEAVEHKRSTASCCHINVKLLHLNYILYL